MIRVSRSLVRGRQAPGTSSVADPGRVIEFASFRRGSAVIPHLAGCHAPAGHQRSRGRLRRSYRHRRYCFHGRGHCCKYSTHRIIVGGRRIPIARCHGTPRPPPRHAAGTTVADPGRVREFANFYWRTAETPFICYLGPRGAARDQRCPCRAMRQPSMSPGVSSAFLLVSSLRRQLA